MRAAYNTTDASYASYSIFESENQGTSSISGLYSPVKFTYPLQGNEKLLGYDLLSDSVAAAALIAANSTQNCAFSDRVVIAASAKSNLNATYSGMIFAPVYVQNQWIGSVRLVFRYDVLVEQNLGNGLDVVLFDTTSLQSPAYLYASQEIDNMYDGQSLLDSSAD